MEIIFRIRCVGKYVHWFNADIYHTSCIKRNVSLSWLPWHIPVYTSSNTPGHFILRWSSSYLDNMCGNFWTVWFNEVEWRIYASVSQATIGPDNNLSHGRCQAFIRTNTRILLIGFLGTNFCELLIELCIFHSLKYRLEKWRPFCFGLNVLTVIIRMSSWFVCRS